MEDKIKVLYLITGLSIGGAEVLLHDLIKNIDKDRFDFKVVSITSKGEIGERMEEDGFEVTTLNAKSKINPLILFKLINIIREEQPDILHTHLFHAHMLGRLTGKLTGVEKIVSTIHNTDIGGRNREFLMKLTDPLCTKNVAVAEIVAENAQEKGFTSEEKTEVIYNSIDFENFPSKDKEEAREELNIEDDCKLLVTVGNLTEQKGYSYLIDAMEKVAKDHDDVKLIIVGEGEKGSLLEEKVEENGLKDHVELAGRVPDVNVYLQAADAYVMSSLWEGFPVVLLEASASGLPIIATDVGGNDELIDESFGFLVESKDIEALSKKINEFLEMNDEKIEEMRKNAKKTVKERFTIDKMTKNYENLYKKLTEKTG